MATTEHLSVEQSSQSADDMSRAAYFFANLAAGYLDARGVGLLEEHLRTLFPGTTDDALREHAAKILARREIAGDQIRRGSEFCMDVRAVNIEPYPRV